MELQRGAPYRTKEVLKIVGISRATLYNWLKNKKVEEAPRDRNNFRVFAEADIQRLLEYKNILKQPRDLSR